MPGPSLNWIREYDLTEPMRRDRRSILAICVLIFMDFQFGLVENIVAFDVDVGQSLPNKTRYAFYAILLTYFIIALVSRYFTIFFSGQLYDIEQISDKIIQEFREELGAEKIEQKDEEELFPSEMQGATDRLEYEIGIPRRRYTVALMIRTTLEIYIPVLLGITMLTWIGTRSYSGI